MTVPDAHHGLAEQLIQLLDVRFGGLCQPLALVALRVGRLCQLRLVVGGLCQSSELGFHLLDVVGRSGNRRVKRVCLTVEQRLLAALNQFRPVGGGLMECDPGLAVLDLGLHDAGRQDQRKGDDLIHDARRSKSSSAAASRSMSAPSKGDAGERSAWALRGAGCAQR